MNRIKTTFIIALAAGVFGFQPSAAQIQSTPTTYSDPDAAPTLGAAYRDGEIRLDGRLDEGVWRSARFVTGFVQGEPIEGAPVEEDTRVAVLYDERAIYVGVRMFDGAPHEIGTQLVRRDEEGQYDYFEVSFDPNSDRRTGYQFRVSAAGVQRDVYLYDDVREDENWDAIWESAVHRDSLGWTAELRIPLSQLRYEPSDSIQTWGVNFTRRRLSSNERSYFALLSRERHGRVSVFGRLRGLKLARGGRRLEARPYVLSSARAAPSTPGDPFFDGTEVGGNVGLDLRYGIGSAFTLDLTVNPDFGQVEVDPAVINLSAFETFFPEKRPFFVEDAQIFDFTLSGRTNRLFYSRRIGREPQGSAPSGADFEAIPVQTTIQTAAKLAGRTSSGLSVGVLGAVTGRERGTAYFADEDTFDTFTAEPTSQYGVVRVQQDRRDGATQIGAIVTGMRRNLPGDGAFDFLPGTAVSTGVDFEHNWGGSRSRDWAFSGFLAKSLVRGSESAITGIQRSSNHYFQRPDATRFAVDSGATSLHGTEWRLQFERRSARHWTGGIWIGEITPGFEINDLGFSRSTEKLDIGARISYQEIRPGSVFRSYRLNAFTFHNFRHEALDDAFSLASWQRAHKNGSVSLSADLTFLNYWSANLRTSINPTTMSDNATRGGPLMTEPGSRSYSLTVRTDRRSPIFFAPRFEYAVGFAGNRRLETGLRTVFRPAANWEVSLAPEYSTERERAQYVTTSEDVGYAPTYGRRYLFGDLERRSFSVETRINVAFTPLLTLQLFAQPLISSGDYQTYKQLRRAESFDFDTFEEGNAQTGGGVVSCTGGRTCRTGDDRHVDFDGDGATDLTFGERDFNIRSLRVNAVLRWEYRPGSTVFLVWQQHRRDRRTDGVFDVRRDFDGLFGAAADNVFIVKFNYWLGL